MKLSLRSRQTLLAAALVAACGLSTSVMAADGTITFEGKVVDQTCSMSSSNQNGNFTVALDNAVKGTDLAGTNDTAKPKAFSMQFTGCPSYADISVLFSGSGIDSTGNASNGLLSNTGTAAGVGIQLLGASANPLDLSNTTDAAAQGTALVTPGNNGQVSFDYTAQYFVTDGTALSGGSVNAQVEYTVVYQ